MDKPNKPLVDRRGFLKLGTIVPVGAALARPSQVRCADRESSRETPFIWDLHCHLTAPIEQTP